MVERKSPGEKTAFAYPKDEPNIVITRMFDAPRDLVWRITTDPQHIPNWWGQRPNTTIVREMDVRPGGKWRYVQVSAEGEYEFYGEYFEVNAPYEIVQTLCFMDFTPMVQTTTYESVGARTRFTVISRCATMADRDLMAGSQMEEGASECYERLDDVLAGLMANA